LGWRPKHRIVRAIAKSMNGMCHTQKHVLHTKFASYMRRSYPADHQHRPCQRVLLPHIPVYIWPFGRLAASIDQRVRSILIPTILVSRLAAAKANTTRVHNGIGSRVFIQKTSQEHKGVQRARRQQGSWRGPRPPVTFSWPRISLQQTDGVFA
jgi:hypothetical protein